MSRLNTCAVADTRGPGHMRLVPYRFAATVPQSGDVLLERRIRADGTIETLRIRIYTGAQLSLRIRPYIYRLTGEIEDLIMYTGKNYVDGDNDVWTYELRHPVSADLGQYIRIHAQNFDAQYSYDFSADVEIDHMGGCWASHAAAAHGGY